MTQLTGRTRYRASWLGSIILQVEEECQDRLGTRWRDATLNDIVRGDCEIAPDGSFKFRRTVATSEARLGVSSLDFPAGARHQPGFSRRTPPPQATDT